MVDTTSLPMDASQGKDREGTHEGSKGGCVDDQSLLVNNATGPSCALRGKDLPLAQNRYLY